MNSFGPGAADSDKNANLSSDRRSDRRYDIRLDLRWKLVRRKKILTEGRGTTLNLSSSGIYFESDEPLPASGTLELSIAWPVRLHDVAPLQLVVAGRLVRSSGNCAAVQMKQHEFRTARTTSGPQLVRGTLFRSANS
jgi:hypothetical protein